MRLVRGQRATFTRVGFPQWCCVMAGVKQADAVPIVIAFSTLPKQDPFILTLVGN